MTRGRLLLTVAAFALAAAAFLLGRRFAPWMSPELLLTGLLGVGCVVAWAQALGDRRS